MLVNPRSEIKEKIPEQQSDDDMLKKLQWQTFEYFLNETNPVNGLVADKTRSDWPASIAATGLRPCT